MLTSGTRELVLGPSARLEVRLPAVLRQVLGAQWEFTVSDGRIAIEHAHRGSPYCPPRQAPSWEELLAGLKAGFAAEGVSQDACLPIQWGRETELTISAVQALDPFLKDGRSVTYRSGFLPQPVVRFTGQRDATGDLREGFLTSFVNVSRVQPIQCIDEYGRILDGWLSVLSRLGFHARHISINGKLAAWRRRQVEGITLRFNHLDLPLGDIVLLWNADNPARMAVDLGTGLERLAWARTRLRCRELVFGQFASLAPPPTLDAVRTATLLLAHGVRPAARGAGGITRRVIGTIDPGAARLGVSSLVRASYRYWRLFGEPKVPWPAVTMAIEEELGI